MVGVATWGELEGLCPNERFADQPSAAFCSGVLVESDLVLTSKHCISNRSSSNVRAVLGYYYLDETQLAIVKSGVHEVNAVISTSSDDDYPNTPDFAWLQLNKSTLTRTASTRILNPNTPVADGDMVITVNAGGGVPLKADVGGTVVNARRQEADYFIASLDAFSGSSGGGVFTPAGDLIGVVAQGSPDFVGGASGCMTSARLSDGAAQERIVYARRAVRSLCSAQPERMVCSDNQADIPLDGASTIAGSGFSCTLSPRSLPQRPVVASRLVTALVLLLVAMRRKNHHKSTLRDF
ncbi:MAG: serine protease [Polyangiaceae bacterium]